MMSHLTDQTIATIKFAARQLPGAKRRAFQAQVAGQKIGVGVEFLHVLTTDEHSRQHILAQVRFRLA
ncbi:MAG: hypothetical protein O7G88_07040 [bacterium]|nr:hypothetical protein [bacterium]